MKRLIVIVMAAMLSIAVCFSTSCTAKKETGGENNLSPEQAQQMKALKKDAEEARKTVVARVNGTAITMSDLVRYMNVLGPKYLGPGQKPTPGISEKVKNEALQFLIFQELAVQEALKEGITPKTQDVENGLKKIKERLGTEAAYKNFLEVNGMTEADLRKAIERELRYEMIAGKEIRQRLVSVSVDDKTLKEIYKRDKAHFALPERFTAVDIYFTSAKDDVPTRKEAEGILAALKKNGNDTSKLTGNFAIRQIVVTKAELPVIYTALSRLNAGGVSGVMAAGDGLHIFKLERRDPARQMTFDEARPLIHQELMLQAAEKNRVEWDREMRKNAKVEILAVKDINKIRPAY